MSRVNKEIIDCHTIQYHENKVDGCFCDTIDWMGGFIYCCCGTKSKKMG